MESVGGGGSIPRAQTASSRRLGRSTSLASRAGAGAFAYDGMRTAPLFSSANFARSLRKVASFGHKKASAGDADAAAPPPRRALSSKDQNTVHAADAGAVMLSPRRSLAEPGVAARQVLWEPTRRRRSTVGTSPEEASGKGSSAGALRETMARKTKEGPEKEEAAHRARVLSARLLQWRFANARMEMAVARATSAAENKLFYTWLRVAELRNIQAAKRIVAQRRRQKLKLARLLRPQLPLLASWEALDQPHADAVSDLAHVLSAACTSLPVTAGAQAGVEALHETMFACVGTVTEIEANADVFYATAGATSDTLDELAMTIRQEVDGLEEAMRLARIVTRLQMQEVSLRANLIQARQRLDQDMGVAVPASAPSGWCF
ncbi:hypothetical protein ACQ4PT_035331 [Festuca glaucescens]